VSLASVRAVPVASNTREADREAQRFVRHLLAINRAGQQSPEIAQVAVGTGGRVGWVGVIDRVLQDTRGARISSAIARLR
jgi:hypothetical protein